MDRVGCFEFPNPHLTMSDSNKSDKGDLDMKCNGWSSQVGMLVG